ncbi:hypothetical protein PVAP13_5NG036608 [Panicum virgatum]|uniref:Uncharacterized protein n=1 Tax=Panicum virgatum TaxID=38727 RepID=A0A8T0RJX1_PANVG|nr:hypothetical protein PVAP13_5NG036608 [Panicum virgatum]
MHAHYYWLQKKKSSWHFVPLRALCIAHMCITPLEEATAGRPRMFFSRRRVKWTATESKSTPTFSLFFFSSSFYREATMCDTSWLPQPPTSSPAAAYAKTFFASSNEYKNKPFFFSSLILMSNQEQIKSFEVLVTATRTKASEHYKKVE